MPAVKDGKRGKGPRGGKAGLAAEVFEAVTRRLADRAGDIAVFAETGSDFQAWCCWEALAASVEAGWAVVPHPPYTDCGVVGSREQADLMIFDPATGRRVLVELAVVHDWRTNKWIDALNSDTGRLRRCPVDGLQLILAASLASPVEVNDQWRSWLGMSEIWNEATDMRQAIQLGRVGELLAKGWTIRAG